MLRIVGADSFVTHWQFHRDDLNALGSEFGFDPTQD